jgi:hypothetical protein
MSDQMREQWWDSLDDDTRYMFLAYSLSGVVPESIWQYLVGPRQSHRRRRHSFGEFEPSASRSDLIHQQRRGS